MELTDTPELSTQKILRYLQEFRSRTFQYLLCLGAWFFLLWHYDKQLYHWIAIPLLHHLPHSHEMVAIGVASAFLTPLKLSLVFSFFTSVPLLIYHIWAFITPALYRKERQQIWPLLLASTTLFYLGILFTYCVVLPMMFQFFTNLLPPHVQLLPDIAEYLEFVLKLMFAFGITFQVPIIVFLLVSSGMCTVRDLARQRPYIVVGVFIIAMIIAPPDVFSQILLALPMWLLFEAGLLVSHWLERSWTSQNKKKK